MGTVAGAVERSGGGKDPSVSGELKSWVMVPGDPTRELASVPWSTQPRADSSRYLLHPLSHAHSLLAPHAGSSTPFRLWKSASALPSACATV